MVVNLDFVAVVNGHPFLTRFEGNANEEAGISIEVAHLVDHADAAIGELAAGPVEKAHAAVRANEAILDRHVAGADMFPADEILAVEERLPRRSLWLRGGRCEQSRDRGDHQHWYPFAQIHGAFLLGKIKPTRCAARCAPTKRNQNCKL